VVPAWGEYAGAPLAQALESLRAQDVAARIIVVDNASEPPLEARGGIELIRSDTRLTVGAARNLGLASVHSRYVVFWDADDCDSWASGSPPNRTPYSSPRRSSRATRPPRTAGRDAGRIR
jgi:hypothetical protein